MKTNKILKIISGLVIFFIVIIVCLFIFKPGAKNSVKQAVESYNIPGFMPEQSEISIKNSENIPSEYDLEVTAWLPNWASPQGLQTLKENPGTFQVISPVWYEVNSDATLKDIRPSNYREIQQYAIENNITLIPTIAMFDAVLFTEFTETEELVQIHIDEIVTAVNENDYDGIDLDYESKALDDKDDFFTIISELNTELDKTDKELIVTVLAQWGSQTSYKSFKQTRQVQDWAEIAKHSDAVRIMTYDYTVSRAYNPGPIAPVNWMEEVIEYGLERVPREKLILGVHAYSYEWWYPLADYNSEIAAGKNDPLEFAPISDTNIPINQRPARSYTYETNLALETQVSAKAEISSYQGEKVMKFERINPQTKVMEKRVLVYIDDEGVKQRADLAKKYGLKGIAFWRLGDDDGLYDLIN